MIPFSVSSFPQIMLRRVDFPAPLAPIRPMRELSCTSPLIPVRTVVPPKEISASCNEMSIIPCLSDGPQSQKRPTSYPHGKKQGGQRWRQNMRLFPGNGKRRPQKLPIAHQNFCRYYLSVLIFSEMSNAFTEWVSAPSEMMSTPVFATSAMFSSVMLPDASSKARPSVIFTASAICS